MTTVIDRRIGALLGLAIGDALGAAIEFMPPGPSAGNSQVPTGAHPKNCQTRGSGLVL
jgi:hypothetical protein